MNPRNRKQEVVTVFDGRSHLVALCRGFREGLPVFAWGEAPPTLLTVSQLAAARGEDAPHGLSPGGQDPVALLVFRHHRPYRRETVAELFSVERARPKVRTAARMRNLACAERALRTCVDCAREHGYRMPTSTRQCWDCLDAELAWEVAA